MDDSIHIRASLQNLAVYASFGIARLCRRVYRSGIFYVVFDKVGWRADSARSDELAHNENIWLVRMPNGEVPVCIAARPYIDNL